MKKQDINKGLQNVEALLKEDRSASPQMRAMMQLLVTIIQLLAATLGLDSSNSSTPPSKDPNRPRGAKNRAKGIKRKPGGQKGHEGAHLKKEGLNNFLKNRNDVIEWLKLRMFPLPSIGWTHT